MVCANKREIPPPSVEDCTATTIIGDQFDDLKKSSVTTRDFYFASTGAHSRRSKSFEALSHSIADFVDEKDVDPARSWVYSWLRASSEQLIDDVGNDQVIEEYFGKIVNVDRNGTAYVELESDEGMELTAQCDFALLREAGIKGDYFSCKSIKHPSGKIDIVFAPTRQIDVAQDVIKDLNSQLEQSFCDD